MIHVCFGLHDKTGRYSKFTGTTMLSIFENTNSEVTIHILHDDTLTTDIRDKFIYLAGRYGQTIKFYNIEILCKEKISEILRLVPFAKTSRLSVAALYRLLIPQLLSENEKIIYLDSDIIVNLDLKELWQLELGDKIFAAVTEVSNGMDIVKSSSLCYKGYVKAEDYFNSGVMLMNLKIFRNMEEMIWNGLKFISQNPQYGSLLDQDVLNYLFSTNYLKLPVKFNCFVKTQRIFKGVPSFGKIYHYTATPDGVGLKLDMSDSFNRLWMKYFIKTPFFNEETIGRLYESFRQIQAEQRKAALNLFATMNPKPRAFIVNENYLDMLIENFSVKNDEEVLLVKGGSPLQKIIDVMNDSRGEKIFFIILPNFPFNIFNQAGFIYGKDFVNGFDFMLEMYPTKNYPLVSAL